MGTGMTIERERAAMRALCSLLDVDAQVRHRAFDTEIAFGPWPEGGPTQDMWCDAKRYAQEKGIDGTERLARVKHWAAIGHALLHH